MGKCRSITMACGNRGYPIEEETQPPESHSCNNQEKAGSAGGDPLLVALAVTLAATGTLTAQTVVATITVGANPHGIAVDPATHTIYVANNGIGDNTVSVIDGLTVTTTIPVGASPYGVVVDPATNRVNDIGDVSNTDLSTRVHGSASIIAERAMYWGANTPLGEACHDSIGLSSPHMTFYLPDGQTSNGWETWTLVQNPNPGAVTVELTYLPQGGGKSVTFTDQIRPNSRKTYNVAGEGNTYPGIQGRASIVVRSLDGARPIMVERAMYWNSRGAGTDTIGGYGD
jgi:YVTN family beta-propeller protein